MNLHQDLSQLSNEELLVDLNKIVAQGHDVTARLIAHIAEVDSRKLYLEEAFSSMFGYCLYNLNFSEAATYLRIHAARVARRFPVIFEMVAQGKLHLTAVTMLSKHLTEENHQKLLNQAVHKTKAQIEELIVSFAPKPDAQTEIRKLPVPKQLRSECGSGEAGETLPISFSKELSKPLPVLEGNSTAPTGASFETTTETATGEPTLPSPSSARPRQTPAVVQPLGEERFKIQFTGNRAFRDKLLEAQELLRHQIPNGDIATILDIALTELLEDTKRKRFGKLKRPGRRKKSGSALPEKKKKKVAESREGNGENTENRENTKNNGGRSAGKRGTSGSPKGEIGNSARATARIGARVSRHIPNEIKRAVYERDGGQCTFEDAEGRRCTERGMIEFHHLKPFALGGEHSDSNIVLACKAHNLYAAVQDFGPWEVKEKAAPYTYSNTLGFDHKKSKSLCLDRADAKSRSPSFWVGLIDRTSTSLVLEN